MSAILLVFLAWAGAGWKQSEMWAPLLQNNGADTRVQCHFMKGAAKAGWETMLKRLREKKGGENPTHSHPVD